VRKINTMLRSLSPYAERVLQQFPNCVLNRIDRRPTKRQRSHRESPRLPAIPRPLAMTRESSRSLLKRGKRVNDPSAGSPTETLLRLLLPLDDQVCPTSRIRRAGEPTKSNNPWTSLNHPIGSSDGRCVQRAGT
jgi:hypothetical protein